MIQIPNTSLYNLAKEYHFEVNDDLFLYYGKYMPYNCERTLMLWKEEGLFKNIQDEEILDYILRSKFEHFIDHDLLEEKLKEGRILSKKY